MLRIWAVPISELDRQHLLGEHAELHCIVGALLEKYKAYRNHPETLRFQNRIEQLYYRHDQQVVEMQKRGYKHHRHCHAAPNPTFTPKTNIVETMRNYLKDGQNCMKVLFRGILFV